MRSVLIAAALVTFLGAPVTPAPAAAQEAATAPAPLTRAQLDELRLTLERYMRQERGRLASLQSQVDVATLHMRLLDVAHVDQVRFFGPPLPGEGEQRTIRAFVFVPRSTDGADYGSLLVWQRGEDELELESWSDVPELQELLGRGVTVIAPDYARAPEERLDAVPDYALERYPFLEPGRVEWRAAR